jgi:hypothetical protein
MICIDATECLAFYGKVWKQKHIMNFYSVGFLKKLFDTIEKQSDIKS